MSAPLRRGQVLKIGTSFLVTSISYSYALADYAGSRRQQQISLMMRIYLTKKIVQYLPTFFQNDKNKKRPDVPFG